MPYRRLPNTDAARIRALKAALKKGQYLEIDTIAYPFALKQKIEFFLPKFEVAITNSKLAKEKQFDNSQKFSEYTKKARLYISHFIQVLNPIYCPSIALVKVNYENFKENYTRQKQFQNNSARESGNVAQYRNDADALILEVWNEVERYFEGVKDEEEKRYMCEEYGLVYVFRRGEKERIRRRKEAESITLKLF